VTTLSVRCVLEGHSLYCKPFKVRYFVFVARCAVPLHLQSFLFPNVNALQATLSMRAPRMSSSLKEHAILQSCLQWSVWIGPY